jgi:tripartite-type tricarboxylate transporter receptor subunit TctC
MRLVCGGLAMLAGPGAPALAETHSRDERAIAEFYGGRRMIMISGHTPEGGDRQQERAFAGMTITSGLEARGEDDLHGRLLARHMGRHIPGEPQFVVQIMPGAGGRRAANYLYADAPADGSVIGNLERGLAVEPLLTLEPVNGALDRGRFDPAKLQWLGSLYGDVGFVVAWSAAGQRSTRSLFEEDMLVGGTTPLDDSVLLARALNALLGTRFRLIAGYSGAVELQIAMERGEIAGFVAGSSDIRSRLIPWRETGQAGALLQLGLHRDPAFPDVPLALDFARSPADRQALEFIFARQSFGSPYAAPPGVPPERVAALRRAFDATMSDGDFRADARRLEIDVKPLSGAVLTEMTEQLLAAPDDLRARAASAVAGHPGESERRR